MWSNYYKFRVTPTCHTVGLLIYKYNYCLLISLYTHTFDAIPKALRRYTKLCRLIFRAVQVTPQFITLVLITMAKTVCVYVCVRVHVHN